MAKKDVGREIRRTLARRRTAEKIAQSLFRSGNGEVAERLVLEMANRKCDGGGWLHFPLNLYAAASC